MSVQKSRRAEAGADTGQEILGDLHDRDLYQCYARGVLKGGGWNDDQKGD